MPVVVGVGAAFRLASGQVRRAPAWVGDAGFEWLWRLALEPAKLWRRDLVDGPRFLYRALAETLQVRVRQALADQWWNVERTHDRLMSPPPAAKI